MNKKKNSLTIFKDLLESLCLSAQTNALTKTVGRPLYLGLWATFIHEARPIPQRFQVARNLPKIINSLDMISRIFFQELLVDS